MQIQTQSKEQEIRELHAVVLSSYGAPVQFLPGISREKGAIGSWRHLMADQNIFYEKRHGKCEEGRKKQRNLAICKNDGMLRTENEGLGCPVDIFWLLRQFPLACKGVKVIEATSFAKD